MSSLQCLRERSVPLDPASRAHESGRAEAGLRKTEQKVDRDTGRRGGSWGLRPGPGLEEGQVTPTTDTSGLGSCWTSGDHVIKVPQARDRDGRSMRILQAGGHGCVAASGHHVTVVGETYSDHGGSRASAE